MKKILAVLAVVMTLLWCGSALAQTNCAEIENWNFENDPGFQSTGPGAGNPAGLIGSFATGGFTSEYTEMDPNNKGSWALGPEKYLTIGTSPGLYHSAWNQPAFGDHTTGTGHMLIVNASPSSDTIWKETVAVQPYSNYLFKYWIANSHPDNPVQLQASINGQILGVKNMSNGTGLQQWPVSPPTYGRIGEVGVWQEVTYLWYSDWATSAEIEFIDVTGVAWGDDFAIDDITLCATNTIPPPPGEGSTCTGTDFVTGRKHNNVGGIAISFDADGNMLVTYTIDAEGWCMTEEHLQVGGVTNSCGGWVSPIVKNGNAVPGQFEYKADTPECVRSYTFTVPAAEVPVGCGESEAICLAAHAAIKFPQTCYKPDPLGGPPIPYDCSKTATGWNLGRDFPGSDWSMKYCFKRTECVENPPLQLKYNCEGGDTSFAYNAIPFGVVNCGPPSEAFEAQATNEFGDRVTLAGTARELESLAVSFNSYGCETGHWYDGLCQSTPGATFTHPITANIYDPAVSLTVPIASVTQNEVIPFRPAADGAAHGCPDPAMWWNPDGNGGAGRCQYSIVKVLVFGFPSGITLPDEVVWSVQFNTSHSGYNPIGETACNLDPAGCPYDSLNVGTKSFTNAPFVGIDPNEAEAYWDGWRWNGIPSTMGANGCYPSYGPTCMEIAFGPDSINNSSDATPQDWTGYRPLGAIRTK